VFLLKALLERMELIGIAEPLDGRDLGPVDLNG
jgi:hypothetical protein